MPVTQLKPPSHIFTNVPFFLALRLVRIVSQREKLLERLQELKAMLLSRDYRKNIVDAALEKAMSIPRTEALKKVEKTKNERVVCG